MVVFCFFKDYVAMNPGSDPASKVRGGDDLSDIWKSSLITASLL